MRVRSEVNAVCVQVVAAPHIARGVAKECFTCSSGRTKTQPQTASCNTGDRGAQLTTVEQICGTKPHFGLYCGRPLEKSTVSSTVPASLFPKLQGLQEVAHQLCHALVPHNVRVLQVHGHEVGLGARRQVLQPRLVHAHGAVARTCTRTTNKLLVWLKKLRMLALRLSRLLLHECNDSLWTACIKKCTLRVERIGVGVSTHALNGD